MMCVRFTSLLLWLSLSLLALGDSIAYANHAIETLANHDHAIEANKELQANADMAAATGSKWLRGRKMAIGEPMKEKNDRKLDCELRGKAVNLSKKSFGPSNKDEKSDHQASASTGRAEVGERRQLEIRRKRETWRVQQ